MTDNLRNKTIKGVAWSTIDNFSSLGITFVFGIILARLLTPKDYGTIALLTIFIAVSNVFINSGFSTALIRKPDLNEKDKSTAFYFNIGVGFMAYIVLFFIAPFVSDFYHLAILTPLLRVTGIVVVFSSLAIVQQAILSIRIDFKKQAKISVISVFVSGCTGMFAAYHGYGVWALAFQQVVSGFTRTFLYWIIVRWKPTENFSKESFHYLFGFGSKMLASGLLDQIWVNVYPIVIGKVFSPATLGLYTRAQQFGQLPSSNISNVIQRVTFPVLSTIQNDIERLRIDYRKLLRMSAFIIFPLMTGLSSVASPLVNILLGGKWTGCIIYLQIICFSMMWYPIHSINLNLLQVKGRSDLFLKLEIIKKIMGITVLCCTLPYGLVVMCYGNIVSSLICLIINTYYTGKIINVGFLMQMKDLFPTLLNSFIMWIIVINVVHFLPNVWLQFLIGFVVGALYYLGIAYLSKSKEIFEVINIIRHK